MQMIHNVHIIDIAAISFFYCTVYIAIRYGSFLYFCIFNHEIDYKSLTFIFVSVSYDLC